jgi:hypothetical protein
LQALFILKGTEMTDKKTEAEMLTKQILVRVDPVTLTKLNLLKTQLRLTQSELIRKLIEYAYEGYEKSEKKEGAKND